MSGSGIKRFPPTKLFACEGLILCVLIKEMSETGIEGFYLQNFCCCGLILCVLIKKSVRSWNKKFYLQNFSPAAGSSYVCFDNKGNVRSWIKRSSPSKFSASDGLIFCVLRNTISIVQCGRCHNLGEDCNSGR